MAETKTYREALREGMVHEMDNDESVVLMGEDIGVYGGTHLITDGLIDEYGPKRVIDTPISELGFTGAAVGMAMMGMKPVVEMMTWNFSFLASDQIIQHAAKVRYFSGGQVEVPLVIRGPNGGGVQLSAQHTHSLENLYGHFPGLKVVSPVTPNDVKGMMITAIRDHNPVIFLEAGALYGTKGEVYTALRREHDSRVGPEDPQGSYRAGAVAVVRGGQRGCGDHPGGGLRLP